MNRLSLEERVRVLNALVEGNSIRATCRMTGAAKGTVLRLLAEVGDTCDTYQDETLQNLTCVRVQCDEIWAFCHAKERNNIPLQDKGEGVGDMWTWVAIDADTKLVVSWMLGKRTRKDADVFMHDLSRCIKLNVQISTDGFGYYKIPLVKSFGVRADHGQEVKVFDRDSGEVDTRYSPAKVVEVRRTRVFGAPDPDHISTAYVERQNLTMRMGMRRFTRLTNAFSKKVQNMQRALALHFHVLQLLPEAPNA